MKLSEGTLEFDFINAIDAIKFDEQNKNETTFHGLSHCMKAIDFIAEYDDYYIFVEVKDPPNIEHYKKNNLANELIGDLVGKFRDTFLYRWCEIKLDKPIRYYCFVNTDSALALLLTDKIKKALPLAKRPERWQKSIADVALVVNFETWNKNLGKEIQISRKT